MADLRRDFGALDGRTILILVSSATLLTIYFYFAQPSYFDRHVNPLFAPSEWKGLYRYFWWASAGLLIRIGGPLLLLLALRENPSSFGFKLRGTFTWEHIKIYLFLYLAILPLLYGVSLTETFQQKYPFYRGASLGLDHFALFELTYLLQFVALEAFFRGYLLFGLERRFGQYSLFIMAVPYCMIHFGKPMSETLGAIFAGVILGYLALKSRTFWYGVALHWAVGLTMDLLALAKKT